MGKKTLEQVIRDHQEFGFDKAVIEIAYANVGGDSDRIIEEIFRLQQESQGFPTVAYPSHRNPPIPTTKTRNSARPSSCR
jgi:hypothetical protein